MSDKRKKMTDGDWDGIGIEFDPPMPVAQFHDIVEAIFNPMTWAAKKGARYAEIVHKHDPCEDCGHGRLLHKKQAFADKMLSAIDAAMTETHCRSGIEMRPQRTSMLNGLVEALAYPTSRGGETAEPCQCPRWRGVETPIPGF